MVLLAWSIFAIIIGTTNVLQPQFDYQLRFLRAAY